MAGGQGDQHSAHAACAYLLTVSHDTRAQDGGVLQAECILCPSSAPGHAARLEDPTELTLPGPCRLPARLQRGRRGMQARAVIIENDDVVRGGLTSAE